MVSQAMIKGVHDTEVNFTRVKLEWLHEEVMLPTVPVCLQH